MALAAALTVLMALLPAGLASSNNSMSPTVTCTEGNLSQKKEVTAANTVLTVVCTNLWTIDPPNSVQNVCEDADCIRKVPLSNYCKDAKAEDSESKHEKKITFGELPGTTRTFYLNCNKPDNGEKCRVEVILSKPTIGTPGGVQPEPPTGGSGTPSVQICEPKGSITVKIPEKGSTAQFACNSGFVLYPTLADKVFSKDCKTEETLSDMKRTDTTAAGAVPGTRSDASKTYTLEADKKPSKKTLCYLCAKPEIEHPGTAEDYCTIYVESGARTQLNLNFTFVLALPCVFAAFQFT